MRYTVFTPTYNRLTLLLRLYEYLVSENYNDLEWIIVDDGSNDGTKEYISEIQTNSPFVVKYFYQKNSGKYIAFNKAIEMSDGEFFLCIDSDDIYIKDAFLKLENYTKNIPPNIAGLCYLAADINNSTEVIGTKFPEELTECNLIEIYGKYGVKGDKGILHRTDILKQYRFPVIHSEKFVTESVLYAQISLKYSYYLINEIIELVDYQPKGLSSSYKRLLINNPIGSLENYRLVDKFELRGMFLLRNTVRYLSFIFFLKENWKKFLTESNHKFLFVICTPLAYCVNVVYRMEKLREKNRYGK